MYVTRIEAIPKGARKDDETTVLRLWIHALFANGQIAANYRVMKADQRYVFHVTSPKCDSLSKEHDSPDGKKARQNADACFDLTFHALGQDLEAQKACQCTHRTAIEMETYYMDFDSVFTCLDCQKPIALYELPYPNDQHRYDELLQWQETYGAVDAIWKNSLSDRFSGKQLVDPHSPLNRQGIALAREMRKRVGYPVYYHLFCGYGKSVKAELVDGEQIHICPLCHTRMERRRYSDDYRIDVCTQCELSYDAH